MFNIHKSGAKVIYFVNTAYDFDKKNHFFAAFCAQKVVFNCFYKENCPQKQLFSYYSRKIHIICSVATDSAFLVYLSCCYFDHGLHELTRIYFGIPFESFGTLCLRSAIIMNLFISTSFHHLPADNRTHPVDIKAFKNHYLCYFLENRGFLFWCLSRKAVFNSCDREDEFTWIR